MFSPNEIIFVPTQKCNLRCEHCFTRKNNDSLDFAQVKDFLLSAKNHGIETLGFSGGEPFLNKNFLFDVVAFAVENDFYFDRIMTNALWAKNEDDLISSLESLQAAGFDGKIGISFDCFHNQNPERIALFIEKATSLWQERGICQLVAVKKDNGDNKKTLQMYEKLSALLNGKLIFESDGFPSIIQFDEELENQINFYENANCLEIHWIDYIAENYEDAHFWQSDVWFEEDFCSGPGNVLYVHGNGDVACCCGYANEEHALVLGSLCEDSFETIMENAKNKPILKTIYETGLLHHAEFLEKKGYAFPGKGRTKDNCLFCGYCIKNNLLQ